jgi:membrane-associated phospholipid phosphatase
VIWSRVAMGAHTPPQTLVGAAIGAGFAVLALT